jgi:hypothetical protein
VSRGAIPAVASADLSLRLVPDQTVAEAADQLRRCSCSSAPGYRRTAGTTATSGSGSMLVAGAATLAHLWGRLGGCEGV